MWVPHYDGSSRFRHANERHVVFFSVKERKSSLPRSRGCCRSPWYRSSTRTGTWRPASRCYWPAAMASQTTETWSTTGCRWCWIDWRLRATNRLSPYNLHRTFDTWNKPSCHAWPSTAMTAPSSPPTTSDPSGSPVPVSCTSVLATHSRTPISKSWVLIKINYSDQHIVFAFALFITCNIANLTIWLSLL